jgi:hypothetical protein
LHVRMLDEAASAETLIFRDGFESGGLGAWNNR